MGSVRLGMVTDALSQGLGLFAGKKAEEERDRIRQQWDMAMAELRETRAMERETRQDKISTERYLSGQETQREATAATKEHRTATLAQSEDQFGRSMDATMVSEAKKGLSKRLDDIYDRYQDAVGDWGDDPGGKLLGKYNQAKDEAIGNFVIDMAGATDAEGKSGAPGFKNMNSAKAFTAKFITHGMSVNAADLRGPDVWSQLRPPSPQETLIPQPFPPTNDTPEASKIDMVEPTATPTNTMADASKIDMVQPGDGADLLGSPEPGRLTTGQRREAAGSSRYGKNPNYDWTHGFFDNLDKYQSGENPYAVMGQRGK